MSESSAKINENDDSESKIVKIENSLEVKSHANEENDIVANGLELNDDCTDLNAENNNEGVLVATIDDDVGLNEFEAENNETAASNSSTAKTTNNINLCNENDNIDDSLQVEVPHDETGLYDDVMNGPNISASEFSNDLIPPHSNESQSEPKPETSESNLNKSTGSNSSKPTNQGYVKRVSCYVGNLTWWTSDKDLTEAVKELGISDLLEIKFYENKINGQSKGFAMVTCGSDQSFRTLMDKLSKKQIHGQEPVVTPFSRHYFNQFEEQARRDMPSSTGNNNNTDHHQYQSLSRNNDNHHHNNNNNSHQYNSHQSNSYQMMNRSRFPSNNNGNSNMPSGLLGQGPRPNIAGNNSSGLMHQRPGLVGNYQPRHPNNNMNNNQNQSIMGMGNPNMPNNSIRPNFSGNGFSNGNNQRNGINSHQQTSLMGNRPPLVHNPNGLLPMRPGLNPALVGNNGPIGQGVGLLNNPRLPNMNNNQNNMHGMPRPEWDRTQGVNPGLNNQFNNNLPNHSNPNLQGNPMMPMNQNQNNLRIGQGPNSYQYASGPGNGMSQNGILPNPPFPGQPQQPSQNQPNFQHPHSTQSGFNSQINPSQQQPMMNHQMNSQSGQHMLNNNTVMGGITPGPQSQLGQMNIPGSMPHHGQHQSHIQDPYYHQNRPDSQATSPGLGHGVGHHQQMHMQQTNKLSDLEFQEAYEKNRIVSSSAITRAVQDASIGQYPSAIETLITAISLIKQSKIANDERCKVFIMSLQDTKKGIEDKYYGSSRSLSGGSMDASGLMMGSSRGESRDRERLKRSRSRDSRDRRDRGDGREDRDRERDRDRSERSDRERSRRSEKHHRSHRERSSRDRSRDRRTVVSSSSMNMDNMVQGDYYDEPVSTQSSRYHRSRH